jgi:hypothetical protein
MDMNAKKSFVSTKQSAPKILQSPTVTYASSILQIPSFSWIFVIYFFLLCINYSCCPFSANENVPLEWSSAWYLQTAPSENPAICRVLAFCCTFCQLLTIQIRLSAERPFGKPCNLQGFRLIDLTFYSIQGQVNKRYHERVNSFYFFLRPTHSTIFSPFLPDISFVLRAKTKKKKTLPFC